MPSNNQMTDLGAIPVRIIGATPTSGGNQIAIGGTIAQSNTYQQIASAGQAAHGGQIECSSTSLTANMFVDFSSGVVAGAAASPSPGAVEMSSKTSALSIANKYTIPPTLNPVFVYGPAGAVFKGFVS